MVPNGTMVLQLIWLLSYTYIASELWLWAILGLEPTAWTHKAWDHHGLYQINVCFRGFWRVGKSTTLRVLCCRGAYVILCHSLFEDVIKQLLPHKSIHPSSVLSYSSLPFILFKPFQDFFNIINIIIWTSLITKNVDQLQRTFMRTRMA